MLLQAIHEIILLSVPYWFLSIQQCQVGLVVLILSKASLNREKPRKSAFDFMLSFRTVMSVQADLTNWKCITSAPCDGCANIQMAVAYFH